MEILMLLWVLACACAYNFWKPRSGAPAPQDGARLQWLGGGPLAHGLGKNSGPSSKFLKPSRRIVRRFFFPPHSLPFQNHSTRPRLFLRASASLRGILPSAYGIFERHQQTLSVYSVRWLLSILTAYRAFSVGAQEILLFCGLVTSVGF
ncbi:hypothetical protein HDK77DRAFT_16429 [Phyllosticta capitalensis]